MQNTFQRIYQLKILKPIFKTFGRRGKGSAVAFNAEQFILEDYRLQGTFRFSSSGAAATADSHIISVYNAPNELISILRDSYIKVELRAGYRSDNGVIYDTKDKLPLIFKGEKVKAKTYRDGLDTVTDILMSTALTEKRESITSEYFNVNTPISKVLQECAPNLAVVIVLDDKDKVKVLRKGMQLVGNSAMLIQQIVNSYGLVHWYQNEVLYVSSPRNLALTNPKNSKYLIDPGRIKGVINWTTDDTVKAKGKDPSLKADFTTFLIPEIAIGSSIQLEIDGVVATLTVTAFEHDLDTHGEQWETRIVAESVVK